MISSKSVAPTVVIADANDDARTILTMGLGHAGYACVPVANGEEAYARTRDLADAGEVPFVVLTDLYLPAAGEPCLVRALKRGASDGAFRDVPVIVHTIWATSDDRVWALEHGCDALLIKPAPLARVVAAVARALGRSRGGAACAARTPSVTFSPALPPLAM
jgi:CheY-like chemotaxis protein